MRNETNDIKIERLKAERIIATVLRTDGRMLPERANAVATSICNRLLCSMTETGNSGGMMPAYGSHFRGRTFE